MTEIFNIAQCYVGEVRYFKASDVSTGRDDVGNHGILYILGKRVSAKYLAEGKVYRGSNIFISHLKPSCLMILNVHYPDI